MCIALVLIDGKGDDERYIARRDYIFSFVDADKVKYRLVGSVYCDNNEFQSFAEDIDISLLIIHLGNGVDYGNFGSIPFVEHMCRKYKKMYVIGYSGALESERGDEWKKVIDNKGVLSPYKDRITYRWGVNTGKELNWKSFFEAWKGSNYSSPPPFDLLDRWGNVSAVFSLLKFGYDAAHGCVEGIPRDEEMIGVVEQRDWWQPVLAHPDYEALRVLRDTGDAQLSDLLKGFQADDAGSERVP